MSTTSNPDPRLERRIQRNGTRPAVPRELTTTPIERPLTAAQERAQRLPSQEPNRLTSKEPEEVVTEDHPVRPESPPNLPSDPPLDHSTLDLQTLLLALTRQASTQPKRRTKGVKEPDPFSGGSPDELRAFIFQCQIYFRACEGEFMEDTEKIFFAISYLRGVALDYFEPFINEADDLQAFDFLEDWLAFVQKLSNLFGSYSPEDDDEDAIVAIPFPSDSKAVNYFIQFAKYQNRIRWDDRSLRKVVKDALPNRICDELRFCHEDISTFEGLKRAVLRVDNSHWKRKSEENNKPHNMRSPSSLPFRTPRTDQNNHAPATSSSTMPNRTTWERPRPSPGTPRTELSNSPLANKLGPDG